MPATALDPRTALVLIDLQRGLANFPLLHPFEGVVANAVRLVEGFRSARLPVVLVTVSFAADDADRLRPRCERPMRVAMAPDFAEPMPGLAPQPGDIAITKRQWNAFYGTELDLQLRRRQITGIVLAGVATSIGVDTTARGAHERAYNVSFASDAMTDTDAQAHEVALTKIFPRMGEVDTSDALLALLPRA